MNQSECVARTSNLVKAPEKSRIPGAIGFASASHWLKNWRDIFEPITQRSNRNRIITYYSHVTTAMWELTRDDASSLENIGRRKQPRDYCNEMQNRSTPAFSRAFSKC